MPANDFEYYKSRLFFSAYILYELDNWAIRDYVRRFRSQLIEAGDANEYTLPADFDVLK